MKTRPMTLRDWLVPVLFVGATVYAAFNLGGCATLGQGDLETKLITAASKCISDAATVLAANREAAITADTAASLLSMQREANAQQLEAAKACKTPDPAQTMPLQSRKP